MADQRVYPRNSLGVNVYYLVATLCLLLPGQLPAGQITDNETQIARLKAEAIANWEKLESTGSQLEGSFVQSSVDKNGTSQKSLEGRFLISGKSAWFDFQQYAAAKQGLPRKVFGRTPDYSFALLREQKSDAYVLRSFGSSLEEVDDKLRVDTVLYAGVPWALEIRRLRDLIADPECVVKSIDRDLTDNATVLLRAQFSQKRHKNTAREFLETTTTSIELDTKRRWAVQGYKSQVSLHLPSGVQSVAVRVSINYADSSTDEAPVPVKYTQEMYDVGGQLLGSIVTEYPKWAYRRVAEVSEMGLTRFGLPEPASARAEKGSTRYLWFLGLAVAFAVTAFVLRQRMSVAAGK